MQVHMQHSSSHPCINADLLAQTMPNIAKGKGSSGEMKLTYR